MFQFFRNLLTPVAELAPGRGWTVPVVGESNFQDALKRIHQRGNGHDVKATATLSPEPANKHDSNAVRVSIDGHTVGYLSRDMAPSYAMGETRCSAKVCGGFELQDGSMAHCGVKLNMAWPPRLLSV
jgi:hypothetical protein